ncbi:MAG: fibronectin-binding protein (FBP) [Deltaproteobacteria bacterium RIFOXYA12_FULL_61_11]|nr:MAG: fibronectin-binding protein (FBP) [Deltaproteobacteria bacterium RIFOXYA12_FULL_61_11]
MAVDLKAHLKSGGQVLKTRDDHAPVFLNRTADSTVADQFTLPADSQCSWAKPGESFCTEKLRPRIEPWLTALVQSEHLSLLVGSGLTHAVHRLGTGANLPGMNAVTFKCLGDEITQEAKRTSEAAGRHAVNFEDQIRVANELLRGLEILAVAKEAGSEEQNQVATLRSDLKDIIELFAKSILQCEESLAKANGTKREEAFNYLISFLMSFASRAGTRERLQLFTTNYDRFIEAGADAAGLRLIDRFVGTLAPVFRASRLDVDLHYNPPGIRGEPRYLEGVARFTKLHGSVDWLANDGSIRRIGLPFGAQEVAPFLSASGLTGSDASGLMIYPNAAKDRETLVYPYVELFRDFAAAICRPNSTVVCYGYSFGDEHINRVLEDMLTIPSAHLVIIAYDDPLGRIMDTYKRLGRHAQITLLIGNHLGDLLALVNHYLPKPAIDRTTFRMAELLKARWGTGPQDAIEAETPPTNDGGSAS